MHGGLRSSSTNSSAVQGIKENRREKDAIKVKVARLRLDLIKSAGASSPRSCYASLTDLTSGLSECQRSWSRTWSASLATGEAAAQVVQEDGQAVMLVRAEAAAGEQGQQFEVTTQLDQV